MHVTRSDNGVVVETAAGGQEKFDAVVFATHCDVTLKLLGDDVDPQERDVLGAIPYNDNDIYLHTGEEALQLRNAERDAHATDSVLLPCVDGCLAFLVDGLTLLPSFVPQIHR
jgi:predicted NAD/FAD-binding protein